MSHYNTIFRRIIVSSEYQPLSTKPLICTVNISTPPTNTGAVFFKSDDKDEELSVAGEYHHYININLADIHVKGNPGDMVTVIGGTC